MAAKDPVPPVQPPHSPKNDAKPDSAKPTKPLATDRAGDDKQFAILRAYGAIAAEQGVTGVAIGEVVNVHPATVSVCHPFFADIGLIERSGGGYKASPDVVAYHRAYQWDPATAAYKLAPTLRESWFWKQLQNRLMFRPIDESEAIRVLADFVNAGPSYRPQIRLLLTFLEAGGLLTRDGNMLKRGPTASPEVGGVGGSVTEPLTPTPPPPPANTPAAPSTLAPGISFDASINITMDDIGKMTPEQIKEFFAGLATVIAAKGRTA